MAKEIKEQKMNFFYLDDEEELKKNKAIVKKKIKRVKKNEEKENKEENKFSFDNEIVIGVTKKEEPNKEKNNTEKKKQQNNKTNKQHNQKQKTNKKRTNKKAKTKRYPKNQDQLENRKIEDKEKSIKKKRKIIKYGILSILFITVILCAMYSPLFNIKTIQIEGNKITTENEIISLSQIQIGENTFKLSKNKIKKQIKENAYIEEVVIKRKLPSSIIITVEEREPAYLLEYAGGYIYVDKQGYMLEINEEKLELPILQGAETETAEFIVGNRLVSADLEKLALLIKIMELADVNELTSLITRIDIENKENIKLIFETEDKIAYLGDTSNLNTKILMIKSILEKEEGKAGEIFVNIDLNKEYPIFRERV